MAELERRDSMLARNFAELGDQMRRLRKQRELSLDAMAIHGLSASTLRRYETGQEPHPRLGYAAQLDRMYQADGWIELSLAQLLGATWDPWREDWPANSHIRTWPAALEADVWIRIKPRPDAVGTEHAFILSWGHWYRQHTTVLPAEGEYLVTGKQRDDDGIPKEFRIACAEQSFYLRHGASLPPAGAVRVVDIRVGWERNESEHDD